MWKARLGKEAAAIGEVVTCSSTSTVLLSGAKLEPETPIEPWVIACRRPGLAAPRLDRVRHAEIEAAHTIAGHKPARAAHSASRPAC